MKKLIMVAFAMAFGFSQAALVDEFTAGTVYVDPANPNAGDGTVANPYKTVEAAVAAAAAGSKIILAAGVYDSEAVTTTLDGVDSVSRIVLTKKLYLLGAGRDYTIIVGADATTDADEDGLGTGAIRGILATDEAAGSLVEGLTIKGGRTVCIDDANTTTDSAKPNIRKRTATNTGDTAKLDYSGANYASCGGGIYFTGTSRESADLMTMVDCSVENCRAGYAGGAIYGNIRLVRCYVATSYATSFQGGTVTRVPVAFSSVFAGNGKTLKDLSDTVHGAPANYTSGYLDGVFVNCTFNADLGGGLPHSTDANAKSQSNSSIQRFQFYNCIFWVHGDGLRHVNGNVTCLNCCQNAYGSLANSQDYILDADGNKIFWKNDKNGNPVYWMTNVNGNVGSDYYPRLGEDDEAAPSSSVSPCHSTSAAKDYVTPVKYGRAQFVCGYGHDVRLREGSILINRGDTKWYTTDNKIALMPAEYLDKDFYGNDRVKDGQVDQGAAEGGFERGTIYTISGYGSWKLYVNGCLSDSSICTGFAYTGVPGSELEIGFNLTANNEIYALVPSALKVHNKNSYSTARYAFPNFREKSVRFRVEDASRQATETYVVTFASSVKWVDPVNGSDSNAGTEAAPYRTLQCAVNNSSAKGVVLAKPGVYAEGDGGDSTSVCDSDWYLGTRHRVKIQKNLRLVGVEGAEKTVIMGAASTDTEGLVNKGCGTGAMRCVGIQKGYFVQVQGFTLTGGHTESDPVGKNKKYQTETPGKTIKTADTTGCYNFSGGAVCAGTSDYAGGYTYGYIDDCIISNNVAYIGSALTACFARRCVITENRHPDKTLETNNVTYVCYVCHDSWVSHCLVYNNDELPGNYVLSGKAYNSFYNNIVWEKDGLPFRSGEIYNNIVYKCKDYHNYSGLGNICWPAMPSWSNPHTVADPMIGVDLNGRLMIAKDSPALTVGVADATSSDAFAYVHGGTSIDGFRAPYGVAQTIPAGPYLAKFAVAKLNTAAGENMAVTGTGVTGLEPNDGVLVTYLNGGEQATVTASDPRKLVSFKVNGETVPATGRTYAWDPATGSSVTVSPVYAATQDWFVDAVNGDDASDGFTTDTAKKTLNNALVYTKSGDTVHAAEGVYTGSVNTKAYTGGSLPAVAVVPNGVTLVADGERDKTIIEGKWGTGTSTQSMTFGPDAIRGLVMMTNTVLQGFLIRNCGTFNSGEVSGGAVYGTPWSTYKDCFFSNCCARSTCAAFTGKGTAIRCKFYRMGTGGSSGICDGGKLYNCYIDRCFDNPLGGSGTAVNCTLGPKNCVSFDESSYVGTPVGPGWTLKNVVLLTPSTSGQNDRNMGTLSHCIVHKSQKIRYNTTNWGDTKFVETAEAKVSADGQPQVGSPLIDAGDNDALEEGLSAGTDLAGNNRISHKIVDAGCYEYAYRPTAHVKSVAGGIDPAEDCLIDVGATQIVKATDDKRNVLSFTVTTNGVPVELEAGARSYAWTPMDEDDELFVTATYATNWYVNANAADDSGTGWTAETPKKTLAGVMEAVIAGDCVHAAPGNYNEGVMTNETAISTATPFRDPSKPHGNRVVIPGNVALVATDGPDVTFITGAKSVVNTGSGGRGVDAVRCVAIRGGSYLEGFTLQTGHSNSDGGGVTDDNAGGGILGTQAGNADTPHIVNCVIKSCSAYVGGAAYGCFLERCRITDCSHSSDGITYYSKLRHCVIHDLTGSLFRNCYGADFCTVVDVVYPTWTDPDFGMAGGGCIQNSILNYKSMGLDWKGRVWTSGKIKNSIVSTDSTNVIYAASCENLITNNNRAAIFATGSWKLFKDSVAVDVGDMDRLDAIDDGKGDFEHNQRVYNGCVDLGAYEYDWRPDYKADLKHAKIDVVEASPSVTEVNESNVQLVEGSTLKIKWPSKKGSSYLVNFAITDGTLTIMDKDGQTLVNCGEGVTSYEVVGPNLDTELTFAFSGDGNATLLPFKSNAGLILFFR